MFFKKILQDNSRPAVTKVSQLIDTRSHKQKKYISLMVVPSYSTGKTRTLRVPRALFYGVVVSMLVISAIVLGFYLQAAYHRRAAYNLELALTETEENFDEFRTVAAETESNLIEVATQIYEDLNYRESRAQAALDRQAHNHQVELDVITSDIVTQIEELERMLQEFDEERQAVIVGLSSRGAVIPPVANLLNQLTEAEDVLRAQVSFPILPASSVGYEGVGFLSMGGTVYNSLPTTQILQHQLDTLMAELEVQRLLLENFQHYRGLMDSYLRNFPTLWPVNGTISSQFGWRRNPFGGRSTEFHSGIDIPARTGTHIRAAGGGTVSFVGWRTGYGNVVIINHGGGIQTLYAHNSRNLVREGQRVERGMVIAHVGSTGRATGSHVHYEVIVNGTAVNPVPFMLER